MQQQILVNTALVQEKVALKEEKDRAEAKYKTALVDNRKEGVSPLERLLYSATHGILKS